MNWDEAIKYAINLRLSGYNDWRLPTEEELFEVVGLCGGIAVTGYGEGSVDMEVKIRKNKSNAMYQFCYEAKGFDSGYYRSSTMNQFNNLYTWCVYFPSGSSTQSNKDTSVYIRCVS